MIPLVDELEHDYFEFFCFLFSRLATLLQLLCSVLSDNVRNAGNVSYSSSVFIGKHTEK